MKKLIIINGPMGIGKTTICKRLYKKLNSSVWLDGDWCWMMNPFRATEENRRMVEDNITYLLNNFLDNSGFEYVIFNWVIHHEDIFKIILDKLQNYEFELYKISLICSKEELEKRMLKDGRKEENIKMSLERLKLYQTMKTIKIDTTNSTVEKIVDEIINIIERGDYL
ncbi:nucleotide kinase [Orenia metallireducens]|uniref:Nucleotide kinase n=1 Tax=Orenia metallireducens TaxID=1413210 RepID=A0A1C0A6H8_9FIRM|nr:AAA family ATPase [Orenia metallireducens]OCL25719.1 nucleotide kinase [Orenia metallireducens]